MSDSAKPTGGLNARGNRRGMNARSREALARGRENARNQPRDHTGNFISKGSVGKLRGISARVKKYVRAMNENPDVLEQALVGSLLASLKDTADWEREAIEDIRARRRAISVEDDPTGAERIKVHNEALPIIAEIRKSRKLAQELLTRAAEIKARLKTDGRGYLEDRYGDGARGGSGEDQPPPPDAEDAEVLEDDDTPTTPAPGPAPQAAPAEEPPPREDAA